MLKFKVISDSMLPLIKAGDELEVIKLENDYLIKRFDILLFKSNIGLICHYFWKYNEKLDKGLILTRSLKDGRFDNPIKRELVVGIVTNYRITTLQRFKVFLLDLFSK